MPIAAGNNYYKKRNHSSPASVFGVPVRGYIKISQAAEAFNYDFRNKTVLDIGSSTGGFTQYALEHGAKKIVSVEKGTNQMKVQLRYDPHVELHEKTDFFGFKTSSSIDVVLADVSFVSLKPILTHAAVITSGKADYMVMLKPQFEATPQQLNNGTVKNEKIRRIIIKDFEKWLKDNHFLIINKHDNRLKGKKNNRERFYLLQKSIS